MARSKSMCAGGLITIASLNIKSHSEMLMAVLTCVRATSWASHVC
jgi:hypothetical protein